MTIPPHRLREGVVVLLEVYRTPGQDRFLTSQQAVRMREELSGRHCMLGGSVLVLARRLGSLLTRWWTRMRIWLHWILLAIDRLLVLEK